MYFGSNILLFRSDTLPAQTEESSSLGCVLRFIRYETTSIALQSRINVKKIFLTKISYNLNVIKRYLYNAKMYTSISRPMAINE